MLSDQLRELSAWLTAAGIDELELTGPSVRIRLGGDGAEAKPDRTGGQPGDTRLQQPFQTVTAPTVGLFLHRHPLHATALAPAGRSVRPGQIIGLLQVDMLLMPVVAPRDGRVRAILVPHGTMVGFATALIELQSIERQAG